MQVLSLTSNCKAMLDNIGQFQAVRRAGNIIVLYFISIVVKNCDGCDPTVMHAVGVSTMAMQHGLSKDFRGKEQHFRT